MSYNLKLEEMGCGSCGTNNGLPKGCNNNGACSTDGCGKLSVFDWLSNMKLPNGKKSFDFVEVRFKNDRKFYYKNEKNISLNIGDVIAVEGTPGYDIGVVTLTGELVRIQMKKKNIYYQSQDIKNIYRLANQKDIETWHELRKKEKGIMIDARIIAKDLKLEMKICDVEYQGDGSKLMFFYTAEGRVDFRQLIKEYASRFSTRIEMKQIGFRQESAKIGGIGSCGRELCCSTWLSDFRTVNTSAARYQQLSINSQKLAGQCGKLKCCLNFELDSYLDALKSFPPIESKFETTKGFAHCVKIDVFKNEMWFAYDKGSSLWYKFSVKNVKDFISLNKTQVLTDSLEDLSKDLDLKTQKITDVIEEDSLERFERKERSKTKKKNNTSTHKSTSNSNKHRSKEKSEEVQKNNPRNSTNINISTKNKSAKPKKRSFNRRSKPNNEKE